MTSIVAQPCVIAIGLTNWINIFLADTISTCEFVLYKIDAYIPYILLF